MSELLQSKFFDLYWHYFVAGLAVYIGARLTYFFFNSKEKKEEYRNFGNEADFKTPDQSKFCFAFYC